MYRGSLYKIVKDVEVYVKDGLREGTHYEVIVDRREAIQHAHNMQNLGYCTIAGRGMRITKSLKDKNDPF